MKLLILLSTALVLTGCAKQVETIHLQEPTRQVEIGSRIEVTRLGVFRDGLAYGDYRGVYLIHDKETDTDFVGVSGVGISEIGRHGCGKGCIRRDER